MSSILLCHVTYVKDVTSIPSTEGQFVLYVLHVVLLLRSGEVVVEVSDPLALHAPQSNLLTAFDPTSSLLLAGVKGQRSVQLWNMDITETRQVTVKAFYVSS